MMKLTPEETRQVRMDVLRARQTVVAHYEKVFNRLERKDYGDVEKRSN